MSINLDLIKKEQIGSKCPVCSNEIKSSLVIGFRIPNSISNVSIYGENIIYHHMNFLVCCSNDCAIKVTKSWQGDKKIEDRKKLIKRIKEDVKLFRTEFARISR